MGRFQQATGPLSPIIADTTGAAGITVAAATGLTQHLFAWLFRPSKRHTEVRHSDSPHHAYAHCGGFAPAARRSARALVSVPFSGLLLPQPLRVKGMVGRYPAICLIRRSLIVKRKRCILRPFRLQLLPGAVAYGELTSVSRGCAPLYGRLTTCY